MLRAAVAARSGLATASTLADQLARRRRRAARASRRADRALRAARATLLDDDAQRRLHAIRCASSTARTRRCRTLIEGAPQLIDFLGDGVARALRRAAALLDDAGHRATRSTRAWCAASTTTTAPCSSGSPTALGAQGTVAGGGRYDGLFEQLGGKPTPACGFAIGIERMILLLQDAGRGARGGARSRTSCTPASGPARSRAASRETLRDRGARVVVHAGGGSFKSQMKKADASGARSR